MRVVITGAAGKIGTQMVQELMDNCDLRLIDRIPVPGQKSIVADLAIGNISAWRRFGALFRSKSWVHTFEGADVVLHLAADVRHDAPWGTILRDNIEATWNVIQVAVRYKVPRVIFASSN